MFVSYVINIKISEFKNSSVLITSQNSYVYVVCLSSWFTDTITLMV